MPNRVRGAFFIKDYPQVSQELEVQDVQLLVEEVVLSAPPPIPKAETHFFTCCP